MNGSEETGCDAKLADVVRQLIEREELLSLPVLAEITGTEQAHVKRSVQKWVEAGVVEWIQPVAGGSDGATVPARADLLFCRHRGTSDEDCLWQQNYVEGRRRGALPALVARSRTSREGEGQMRNVGETRWAWLCGLVAAAVLTVTAPSARADGIVQLDEGLPSYQQVEGVSGNLNSIGSDTLNNLMALWTESFRAIYPNVNIQVEGKGSSTAPPALIEGTAQLGPMSRPMKSTEIDAFEKRYGYRPVEIRVAVDALAVFVHKDNPLAGLTLQQIDSIFSSTFKRGGSEISTWGQLGLTGDWANRSISLYGRNSASGTYGFFKEHALDKGDYRPTVKEQPGSSAVVTGIGNDLYGIGYSGIGYRTAGVRPLPLGLSAGSYVEASPENALSGDYPLARFLLIYVNKKPGVPMDKLTQEFLRFVLSRSGQEVVVKDGYFPLPAEVIAEELQKLQ